MIDPVRRAVRRRALALLVLGSTGLPALGGCGKAAEPPTELAAPDSVDQVLFGVRHQLTENGVLRGYLEADTVFVYEGVTADLFGVKVDFMSARGSVSSTVTSLTGKYDFRSGDMEAHGNVVATTPDGRRLTTSVLKYDGRRHEISGPEAFHFTGPDGELEGDGFVADPEFRNVVTERPRKGTVRDVREGRR
ncbi:MAG: LPS export ABC transporter periplasmic protein LptC [Gemmatimonadales bacterium]